MQLRTVGIAAALLIAAACRTSGSTASGGTQTSSSAGGPSSTETTPGTTTTTAPPGSPSEATAGQDPLMQPGPDIKGHAEDRVVTGAIHGVSAREIAITSDRGDTVVLEIVPETSITVNGLDARHDELREGQQVRASYHQVQGQGDVAVEIRALPSSSGTGPSGSSSSTGTGSMGPSDATGTGASGSSPGSTGSSSGAGDTSGTPSSGGTDYPPHHGTHR